MPPVEFLAHIVPEVGGDLVQLLRLLRGAGQVDDDAGPLRLGPQKKQQVHGMVFRALDIGEISRLWSCRT